MEVFYLYMFVTFLIKNRIIIIVKLNLFIMYEKTYTTFKMLKDLGIKSTVLLKQFFEDAEGYSGYFVGSNNRDFNVAIIFSGVKMGDFINHYIYVGKGNFELISTQTLYK